MDTEKEKEIEELQKQIANLQICVDAGHSYETDEKSFIGPTDEDDYYITIICSRCGYEKEVRLKKELGQKIDKPGLQQNYIWSYYGLGSS